MGLSRSGRGVVAALVVLGPLVGAGTRAGAAPTSSAAAATAAVARQAEAVDPPPGQGISLAVAEVPATSPELDAAEAERERLSTRQREATEALVATDTEAATVERERTALTGLLARRDEQIVKADAAHAQLRVDLRAVAIEWFITGFDRNKAFDPTLSSAQRDALARGRVLAEAAAADTLADERHVGAQLASLRRERESMGTRKAELDGRAGTLAERREELARELEQLAGRLTTNEERLAEARMSATIEGTDLSTAALDAYWRAAQVLSLADADCAVPWWALAGIGRTESRHGTYRGASVGRDGVVTPPIYGPDLDGSNTFRVVPDSDGGRLDGTATTDRATGPMQFLPGTWNTVGRDATGDGVADPQNLYDAALSAGVYLCRSGPGLLNEATLRSAYLTYNRSMEYVDIVLGHAYDYRRSVPLP